MKPSIVVTEASGVPIDDLAVEIVERKGMGHPDSLCDGIAERISREYTRYCQDHLGAALHHNFDKVQLVAGEVHVRFGGGELVKPIRIQIAGRATKEWQGQSVPVDEIAVLAAKAHLRETLRHLDPESHVIVESYVGRGSSELVSQVHQVMANDTSFGCSHFPRSRLEHVVYEAAQYVNGPLLTLLPVGEDIKVMGCRTGDDITLTVALPFLAQNIKSPTEYEQAKQEACASIKSCAERLCLRRVNVQINTADRAARGDYYLTLTGTSAEMGDDGAVGRGNRANGLITPFRSVSLEAVAGKNPVSHVGKIYNVMSLLIAQDIIAKVPQVRDVSVYLLSQIGQPLDEPLVATATVRTHEGTLPPLVKGAVEAVIAEHLHNDPARIRPLLAAGTLKLY